MMIDSSLQFSAAQALTVTAESSTIINTNQSIKQGVNFGIGEQLWLVIALTAAMVGTGTISAALRTSATQSGGALSGTINTLLTLATIPAASPAGTMIAVPLPPAFQPNGYLQYLDIEYTLSAANTGGAVNAFITTDIDANFGYPVGYSVG